MMVEFRTAWKFDCPESWLPCEPRQLPDDWLDDVELVWSRDWIKRVAGAETEVCLRDLRKRHPLTSHKDAIDQAVDEVDCVFCLHTY